MQTQADVETLAPVAPGLWRNRNLLILVGGQWVSQIGNTLFTMAVYWTVLNRTGSRADLGFVGAVLGLAAVFGLVAGALVDRWDRRRTMIWTDVVRALLAVALLGAALAHRLPVVLLVAVVLVMTLVGQFFYPAESALLPTVVADQDLTAANGVNQSGMALSQLVGATLGGAILGLLGPIVLFGFNAASFAVSVTTLFLLRLASTSARPPRAAGGGVGSSARSLWADIVQGQRTIWRNPFLRRALPITVLVNFALVPISVLDVAWVRQVLHMGAFVYGLFGAAILVGMVAGSVLSGVVAARLRLRPLVFATLAGAGLCIYALSRIPTAAADLAFLVVFGLLVGVINTALSAMMQRAVPDEVRGRVFGAMSAFSNLAIPLGGVVVGVAAAVVSVAAIFAGAGLLFAASSFLVVGLPAEFTTVEIVAQG